MDFNLLEYRGVPPELIAEIGMMTIAAAGLDEAVYRLGQELGLDPAKLRRMPSSKALRAILAQLDSLGGLPPWSSSDITLEDMTNWMRDAQRCISDRHLIIHSSIAMQRRDDDDWTFVFIGQRVDGQVRPATVVEVRSLRERIDRLHAQSAALRRALLRQVARGVYVSYFEHRGS